MSPPAKQTGPTGYLCAEITHSLQIPAMSSLQTSITQYASYTSIVAFKTHNTAPGGCPWVPFALQIQVKLFRLADVA